MILISRDITDPNVDPFIVGDHFVYNGDGSVSIAIDPGGTRFAGQEPNAYGVRHDDTFPGAYQKFFRQGNLLSIQTRQQDAVFVYTVVEVHAFA